MANGLYTNSELVDTIIADLNNVLKETASGQYIQACITVNQMAQKLINLRTTIDNDLKNRDETIAKLKNELRNAGVTVEDIDPREYLQGVTDKPAKQNK